jgi:hypothetical protein
MSNANITDVSSILSDVTFNDGVNNYTWTGKI